MHSVALIDREPRGGRIAILCLGMLVGFPLAGGAGLAAPGGDGGQNVLMLVADDLGVDILACYGEGVQTPPTPNLDTLAQQGVRFRNCWSNPVCSPTRATIQTGRYSVRTGIGMIISEAQPALSLEELILPEILLRRSGGSYACAAVGKWHLGNEAEGGALHPNLSGYPHFVGTSANFTAEEGYFAWPKIENGVASICTTYATTDNVDEALAWIAQAPEPWFCYVAFNAPHEPYHAPPPELHTRTLPPVDPRLAPRLFYEAMVEALDTEIGRLIGGIGPKLSNTNVIFLGDNGTPRQACLPPFLPDHAKMTVYEGGLGVPLIISGPAVPQQGAECAALVNTTDLFATVLDLAGVDLVPPLLPGDSISLVPYLSDPARPSLRSWVYAEIFHPNGPGPPEFGRAAVRGTRFKLIRTAAGALPDEFYDLATDPFETTDLLGMNQPPLVGSALKAHHHLDRVLDSMAFGAASGH